ncbi:TPA: alpha-N-acetylgalactosaminidase, partial [Streptococcus suis]
FHYSYTMFDEERWKANARAVKWIENNYSTLKHSQTIGGKPSAFEIYGYRCIDEEAGKEILSLRNPASHSATIQLDNINLSDYQLVRGDYTALTETEYELAPYTILIAEKVGK